MGGIYNGDNVEATTPELINEYGYEVIFKPEYDKNYCVIFLKNGNFINVLVKVNTDGGKTYCVRDCHETDQYDYTNFEQLTNHLSSKYQFEELTVVDGVLIEEFGNIEYLIVTKPFQIIMLDSKLHDTNEDDQDQELDQELKTTDTNDNDHFYIELNDVSTDEDVKKLMETIGDDLDDGTPLISDEANEQNDSNEINDMDEMLALQLQFGYD